MKGEKTMDKHLKEQCIFNEEKLPLDEQIKNARFEAELKNKKQKKLCSSSGSHKVIVIDVESHPTAVKKPGYEIEQ